MWTPTVLWLQVREQLDEMNEYRPYFTWWVTTVQVFILLLSIMCYGLAPPGFTLKQQSGQVSHTSSICAKKIYYIS